MSKFLRALFRLRPLPALLVCLPALLLIAIYLWRGFSKLDNYRRYSGQESKMTLESLQIAVHDTLRSDLRRMLMDTRPEVSPLRSFHIDIRRQDWETLEKSASTREGRQYVPARLTHKGRQREIQVRLRGSSYWNTSLPQKSLKIRLKKGELLDGHRVFNLLNDPTPMVVGEHLILGLAKELGILTPASDFARLTVNGRDLGVLHYETQPDESLLRQSSRIPGSAFSGDLPRGAQTSELWSSSKRWKKVASRNDSEEEKQNFVELERFLTQVREASFDEFRQVALEEVDLRAFAVVDVLDVAFGGDQHDFRQNHKLYFDPYRGRWEPIAWNFRGFKSDPKFNLVESPILIRLKQVPEYLELRNRLLHEFLTGPGTPASLRARGTEILKLLAPDLKTDPYWDAYRLLPRVDGFHRRMVRPLDLKKAVMVFDSEFATYRSRHAQLLAVLEKNPLFLTQGATERVTRTDTLPAGDEAASAASPAELNQVTPITATVSGVSGAELSAAKVGFEPTCLAPKWQMFTGETKIAESVDGGQGDFARKLKLHPNVGLREREDKNARRGQVRTEILPVNYELSLRSNCAPKSIVIAGQQLSTGARAFSRPPPKGLVQLARKPWPESDSTPRLKVSQLAPHPAVFWRPQPGAITLGPGEVIVEKTRTFAQGQHVVIKAGTRLLMQEDASLIFRGRVRFEGTASAPIEVVGHEGALWGGIALQGPGTRGSRVQHVFVRGGTSPLDLSTSFPAMLNIHDTSDVTVTEARLGHNGATGDLLHAAYVDELTIEDTEVVNTTGDAIDLEFCSATLSRLNLIQIGDDGLDLMGSRVKLSDVLVLGAKGNGLSAGERSQLTVRNALIADSKHGVLAKNASEVELSGSLLYRNKVGVQVYTRSVRYEGDSQVRASVLFVVDSKKKPVQRKDQKRDRLNQGRIFEYLPRPGGVESLRHNLPGLDSWHDLSAWLKTKRREAVL